MEVSLAGRTAVITGGSKGIGLAIATRFAASGADVAIIARGRGALDEAVKSIGAGGKGRVAAIAGDVGVAADIKRAYHERARAAHPDNGGSDAAMAELNRARDEALRVAR